MPEDQLEDNKELGALLARAREKLFLSQKDIASRLNLKESIITALDANDFDKLPAPTYVRGYIRSYARTVKLDADSLIDIYESSAKSPPEILPDVKPVVQASNRDKPMQAITYLVTFALVILIIAWWQGQHIADTDFVMINTKTSSGGKYPGGFTYTYDIVSHPEMLDASKMAKLGDSELKNTKIVNPSKSRESKIDNILSAEDLSSMNAQVNSGILKIELTAESWIEVYDALGKKLYLNLAKPGEKISIIGAVPLSVKLGNAKAVSVNFNGKAFDSKEYAKANIARFLLE